MRTATPVWANLEYLSAEPWAAQHHLLPSPHPTLALTKYFFFPGFGRNTGGLIRERGLFAARDSFRQASSDEVLRVLLFGYSNAPAEALFKAIESTESAAICTVMDGPLASKLKYWRASQAENRPEALPVLEFNIAPFTPQQEFDRLLWRHDVLFVRGEDSFVRAQFAARPFVWHIYPQKYEAHAVKLSAFLDIYCRGLDAESEKTIRQLWHAWNSLDGPAIGPAWNDFLKQLPILRTHAMKWAETLGEMPDLASNLLSFFRKNTKI